MQCAKELADSLQRLVESYVSRGKVDAHDAELILQYQAQHIREEEAEPAFDEEKMNNWLRVMFSEDDKGDYQDYYK